MSNIYFDAECSLRMVTRVCTKKVWNSWGHFEKEKKTK